MNGELEILRSENSRLTDELNYRAKQMGVACMRHDLVHGLACSKCLAIANERIRLLRRWCDDAEKEGWEHITVRSIRTVIHNDELYG